MRSGFQILRSGIAATAIGLLFAGCVSSNVGSIDTQTAVVEEELTYDPVQRAAAVEEIRAKSGETSGELTNAFASGDGPNETLTAREQQSLINELEKNAAQNDAVVPDQELTESQRSIIAMQNKARSHYKNALSDIEN